MNLQNQSQTTSVQNFQNVNANYQQEMASELAQSSGQISQYLLSKSKTGFEFGSIGKNMNAANTNFNQNSELNQSKDQTSQLLAKESR